MTAQTNKPDHDDAPESRPVAAQARMVRVRGLVLKAKAAIRNHCDMPLELRQALDLLEIETRSVDPWFVELWRGRLPPGT